MPAPRKDVCSLRERTVSLLTLSNASVNVEAGREGESVGKRDGCRNVASDLAGAVETHSLFNGQ